VIGARPTSWLHGAVRRVAGDAVYRGSSLLLLNTALLSAFGFAFWALGARVYPASAVGAFSGITAGVGLLGALAGLGLPTTMMRHLAGAAAARRLVAAAVLTTMTAGAGACLVVLTAFGGMLPAELDLARTDHRLLVTVLAMLAAVSAVVDAGLIALRATTTVLVKNLIGSTVKLAALAALAVAGASGVLGLVLAYTAGAGLSAALGVGALLRIVARRRDPRPAVALRRYLSFSGGSYLGTIAGILPLTVMPLMVLVERGAAETAFFSVALMLASFLNFVPSTTSQVLIAEASRGDEAFDTVVVKALRHVYALLVPAVVLVVVAGPSILRIFGDEYADGAGRCLQILAVGALATGSTYLIDAILAARDRMGCYVAMNVANAALVLSAVGLALPHGLAAAALAWGIAQALSAILGLVVLRATGIWGGTARGALLPRVMGMHRA
jgi:O-antigen/teichoic acid export membrane protein